MTLLSKIRNIKAHRNYNCFLTILRHKFNMSLKIPIDYDRENKKDKETQDPHNNLFKVRDSKNNEDKTKMECKYAQ